MGAGVTEPQKHVLSGACEEPLDLLRSFTPTSLSHPPRKTNIWPESVLNNFYYTFSVLYTKEISFSYSDSKKTLNNLAFSLLVQSVHKSMY